MADRLSKLFETYKMNPQEAALKSHNWFSRQVTYLNNITINRGQLMKNRDEMKAAGRIMPGSLYLFEYDALHAATLPYWDRYPLVIPFRQVKGAFYGLNLHYLHPYFRVLLLDKLMVYATSEELTDTMKLKFTWQTAAAAAHHNHIKACVKMYLLEQVNSSMMRIRPQDWVGALMLPTEQFVGASKQYVWKKSRGM